VALIILFEFVSNLGEVISPLKLFLNLCPIPGFSAFKKLGNTEIYS